ncbi:predicted protein [Streptomyces sp. SPB78]|nr:predicted protein [Streptomyces sp. SPB78]
MLMPPHLVRPPFRRAGTGCGGTYMGHEPSLTPPRTGSTTWTGLRV